MCKPLARSMPIGSSNVNFVAGENYAPPADVHRADQEIIKGIRLPYIKFNRQPHEPFNQPAAQPQKFRPIPAPKGPIAIRPISAKRVDARTTKGRAS